MTTSASRHGSYSTSVLAACAVAAAPESPLAALRVGEVEPPPVPDGWVRVQVKAAALNQHDVWSLRGVGLPADRLPMILGCDAAGIGARRPRGDRARGGQRPGLRRLGRDLRPAPLAAVGALPGHAGRAGLGAGGQPGRQAGRAQLRRGGVPADGLADRVPDALHLRGRPARGHRAGPGCRRGSGHRAGRARPARRAADLGDLAATRPGGRGRSSSAPTAPSRRRAAARAGRRGDGDRRRGHLVALGQRPAARAARW